jgi:hypothetical protein
MQKKKGRRSCHWRRQWYLLLRGCTIKEMCWCKEAPSTLLLCFAMSHKISDFLTDLLNRLHDDTNQVAIKIALKVSTLVVAKMGVVGVNFLALRFCWVTLSQYPLFYNAWCLCHVKRAAKRKSFVCTNYKEFTTLI